MPPLLPGAPDVVAQTLQTLIGDLRAGAGPQFAGLVLYGGLARGHYRPGRSDVNVVVLLRRVDACVIKAIAPALRDARRAAAVEALLMTPDEVPQAALDFPTKFLDIQRHHRVLHGDNPFAALSLPARAVQRRVAQSLHNLLLRLRHRFLVLIDEPQGLHRALAAVARPLAIELSALLQVTGQAMPDKDRTAATYAAAATALCLDTAVLNRLAAVQEGFADVDVTGLYEGLLTLLSDLADRVNQQAEAA